MGNNQNSEKQAANMKLEDEMRELVGQLAQALTRYDILRFDEIQERPLGPPATQSELSAMELSLGFALPPSWRAFLGLHNGWKNFRGTANLLSTTEISAPWVHTRIREWEDLLDGQSNPFGDGRKPVLLGTQESSFLVIDPASVRPDGEMSFVMYDYLQEEATFPDLGAYLRHHLAIMQMLIERLNSDD